MADLERNLDLLHGRPDALHVFVVLEFLEEFTDIGANPSGVVQLEIKRRAGRGRRMQAGPDESLFRDSDLAFIAGVVTQAGGRIVSGYENPWIDDLRIELPAVNE